MNSANDGVAVDSRLKRLLSFLAQDSTNLRLMEDAAYEAFRCREFAQAQALLESYSAGEQLPVELLNLKGLIALETARHEEARAIFNQLLETRDDASLRFNAACASAALGDFIQAAEILPPLAAAASAGAATHRIRVLHRLGQLDQALREGLQYVNAFPEAEPLLGALAMCAFDNDEGQRALNFAESAPRTYESQTVLGLLKLDKREPGAALAAFDVALTYQPDAPRALEGKGLALLVTGQMAAGAEHLDRAAVKFGDEASSWVIAGWARLALGEVEGAEQRFEKALNADPDNQEALASRALLAQLRGRGAVSGATLAPASEFDSALVGVVRELSVALATQAIGSQDFSVRLAAAGPEISARLAAAVVDRNGASGS